MKWLLWLFLPFSLFAHDDFQIWNKYIFSSELCGPWSTLTEVETRFGDGGGRLFYWYLQQHLVYRPFCWLEIAPSYRQAFRRVRRRNDRETPEGDPMLAATMLWRRGGLAVEDRSRFQYRFFFSRDLPSDFIYRNRLQATYWFRCGLSPFFSNEIFICTNRGFSQNRLKIGANFQRCRIIRTQMFYLLRNVRGETHHGLGIHLYLDL